MNFFKKTEQPKSKEPKAEEKGELPTPEEAEEQKIALTVEGYRQESSETIEKMKTIEQGQDLLAFKREGLWDLNTEFMKRAQGLPREVEARSREFIKSVAEETGKIDKAFLTKKREDIPNLPEDERVLENKAFQLWDYKTKIDREAGLGAKDREVLKVEIDKARENIRRQYRSLKEEQQKKLQEKEGRTETVKLEGLKKELRDLMTGPQEEKKE